METKEAKFLDLINGYKTKGITDIINSDGEWLLSYDKSSGYTDVSYFRVWSIFERNYNMSKDDIQIFLKEMLSKYLKLDNTIPLTGLIRIQTKYEIID